VSNSNLNSDANPDMTSAYMQICWSAFYQSPKYSLIKSLIVPYSFCCWLI